MIKKYMNQLYKEFVQIRRKIDGGHMKYFGQKDYLNAFEYLIILKNGSYFRITLGTRFIPNIKKKDIAFIGKQMLCTSISKNWNNYIEYFDSDRGRTRYEWYKHNQNISKFEYATGNKYRIDIHSELDTGAWD